MSRRKGELSPAGVDYGWPYQVAVSESAMQKRCFAEWQESKYRLKACLRGHTVHYESEDWFVVCFADVEAARTFKAEWDGVNFDPADRGKKAWWVWNRPTVEPPLGGRRK